VSTCVSHLRTCRHIALACGLSLLLIGCGYKGPLYIPPPPDTLGEQTTPAGQSDATALDEPQNPSLEPAPIIIE